MKLKIRAAGALFDYLEVGVGVSRCGQIHDGVPVDELQTTGYGDPKVGSYVLDWADLEAAYLAIKSWRDSQTQFQ